MSALRTAVERRPVLVTVCVAVIVKAVWLVADHHVLLFMGDSGAFIQAARSGVPPPDRSWVYGVIVRYLAVLPGSFGPLLLAQSAAGVAAAACITRSCRLLAIRPAIACLAGIACALDPLQIYYERHVMTDVFAQCLMAALVLVLLTAIESPRLWKVVLLQVIGVMAIALRTSFLPAVLVAGACLSVAVVAATARGRLPGPGRVRWARGVLLLLVCWLAFGALQRGYQVATGHRAGRPAAYSYSDGFFLLAYLSPAVRPDDAADPRLRRLLAEPAKPFDYAARNYQMWGAEGLIRHWRRLEADPDRANWIAKETAKKALVRRPLEVLALAAETYRRFFTPPLRVTMANDLNMQLRRQQHPSIVDLLAAEFGVSVDRGRLLERGPATGALLALRHRVWVALAFPLWAGLALALVPRPRFALATVALLGLVHLLAHYIIAPPMIRYLLGLVPLNLIVLAALADQALCLSGRRRQGREVASS